MTFKARLIWSLILVVSIVSGCLPGVRPAPPVDFPRLVLPEPVVLTPISGLRVDSTIPVPEKGMFFTDDEFREILRQHVALRESVRVLRAEIEKYESWVKSRNRRTNP